MSRSRWKCDPATTGPAGLPVDPAARGCGNIWLDAMEPMICPSCLNPRAFIRRARKHESRGALSSEERSSSLEADLQAAHEGIEGAMRRHRENLVLSKLAPIAKKHGLRLVYVVDKYNAAHVKVKP